MRKLLRDSKQATGATTDLLDQLPNTKTKLAIKSGESFVVLSPEFSDLAREQIHVDQNKIHSKNEQMTSGLCH